MTTSVSGLTLLGQTLTGTIGTMTDLNISQGTGIVPTTHYGINIGTLTGTTNYSIYTGSSPSYFGGTVTATGFSGPLTGNASTATSAAKWTTARALAGNSTDGSAAVTFANKFVVQGTADAGLTAAQFLGALGTGIVKNTTSTGVLSIATPSDYAPGVASITSQLDITNTETVVVGYTTAAGFLKAGSTLRFHAQGVVTTSTTPGNDTFYLKVNTGTKGATAIATLTVAANAAVTTQPFDVTGYVTIRTATTAAGGITGLSTNVATGAWTTLEGMASSTADVTISNVSNALYCELTAVTGASTSHLLIQTSTVEIVKL